MRAAQAKNRQSDLKKQPKVIVFDAIVMMDVMITWIVDPSGKTLDSTLIKRVQEDGPRLVAQREEDLHEINKRKT
jgi:hypothetical protein